MRSSTTQFVLSGVRAAHDDHEVVPPDGSPTSLHLPGRDPLRVLLLGDGPAVGYTVASHDLALAGNIARTVTVGTDRGVAVDIRADSRMTPGDALERIEELDVARYDAVVLTIGTYDAIRRTPTRSWTTSMSGLIDHLSTVTNGLTPVAIGSIPELRSLRSTAVPSRAGSRSHADMLNLALGTLVLPDTMAIVDLATRRAPDVETPAMRRRRWAGDLVAALGPLGMLPVRPALPATRRDERRRQQSLRRTGVLDSPCPPRLDEIVGAVQRTFAVPVAALNFIDETTLQVKASRGLDLETIDRHDSVCDHTIRENRTLVVPDAAADERFRSIPFISGEGGLPFYAGHPIESPDGERIGSLCVFDNRNRPFSPADVHVLQELAFRVQNELYAAAG